MSENKKLNSGILKGVGDAIDTELDKLLGSRWKKGSRPYFSHKSTYLALLKKDIDQSVDFSDLIRAVDARIYHNFDKHKKQRSPSRENWRFKPNSKISPKNKSPEVCLEREIVRQSQLKTKEWANQSPVASGLLGARSDKGRHVDLVRQINGGEACELIELKWRADNPFFAAMEIICYGLVYLLFRKELHDPELSLLNARDIHLGVLAPSAYYDAPKQTLLPRQTLLKIQSLVSDAIGEIGKEKANVAMDFNFWVIPNCPTHEAVSTPQLSNPQLVEVAGTVLGREFHEPLRVTRQDG